MKKLNYSKSFTIFIALGIIISTTFTSFSEAAGPKVLENYKAYHDTVYAQKIELEKYSDVESVDIVRKSGQNEDDKKEQERIANKIRNRKLCEKSSTTSYFLFV